MVQKVVSGGQTGVDRAALDAALAFELPIGGWCPRGRRAEDGPLPSAYLLDETPSRAYDVRTKWNVRDSDGTLIIHAGPMTSGTQLTARLAEESGKPLVCVDLDGSQGLDDLVAQVHQWIEQHSIEVLNVAGPRESSSPGIYDRAKELLSALFGS